MIQLSVAVSAVLFPPVLSGLMFQGFSFTIVRWYEVANRTIIHQRKDGECAKWTEMKLFGAILLSQKISDIDLVSYI